MGTIFSSYLHNNEPKKVIISVTMDPDMVEKIDMICHRNKISRSFFFREATRLALETNNNHKNRGYVYIAHLENTPTYKIGCSKDPVKRIKHDFGSNFPYDLKAIHVIESTNMYELEKMLHRYFKDVRKGNTEWFELTEDHVEFLVLEKYKEEPELKSILF